jgi:uncharacterized Zn-finger protein
MERQTKKVWRKDNGQEQLIWADKFNPEFHSDKKLSPSGESADEKPFTCEPCEKSFKREQDLKTHNKKEHAVIN